jgi:hypothetical protein
MSGASRNYLVKMGSAPSGRSVRVSPNDGNRLSQVPRRLDLDLDKFVRGHVEECQVSPFRATRIRERAARIRRSATRSDR